MTISNRIGPMLVGVAFLAGALAAQAADMPAEKATAKPAAMPAMGSKSDAELIKSALSAGPPGVAKNATVVTM
ncbi:MAG TPA: hypothetical protein VMT50_00650, partial [Steroidobacteraceae bacterium]|nr:hypothetical protein [Steroidobacteraceae bacterium]